MRGRCEGRAGVYTWGGGGGGGGGAGWHGGADCWRGAGAAGARLGWDHRHTIVTLAAAATTTTTVTVIVTASNTELTCQPAVAAAARKTNATPSTRGWGGQHLWYHSRRPVMIMRFTLQAKCKTVEPLVKLHENQSNVNATKDCPWQRVVGMAAGHRAQ